MARPEFPEFSCDVFSGELSPVFSDCLALSFFFGSETECTSESGSGQFNIFGAVEENLSGHSLASRRQICARNSPPLSHHHGVLFELERLRLRICYSGQPDSPQPVHRKYKNC
jgi:hypothetical protein